MSLGPRLTDSAVGNFQVDWDDFSIDLSISLSMELSMSMEDDWSKGSKQGFGKGPKGDYGLGYTMGDSHGDESIPEVPSDEAVDHVVLLKRSYVDDVRGAMKLAKT